MIDPYQFKARVTSPVDGDTAHFTVSLGMNVRLEDEKMRFNGIDTPELPSHADSELEGKAGLLVAEYVKNLLADKDIYIKSTVNEIDTGKYGRYLVDIFLSKDDSAVSVNQQLLDLGYARPYDGGHKPPWDADMLQKMVDNLQAESQ